MKLPAKIRNQFRRHGRAGGRERAARMSAEARRAVARRAATARWVRERFGATSFEELGLPGAEIVDAGLADLAEEKATAESLLVSLAAPRLRREGVPLSTVLESPEDRLYDILSKQDGDLAHARYTAHLRQVASFANACHFVRRGRSERAG